LGGLEQDTIGGFNSLIEKLKAQEGVCLVTTVLFDNEIEILHDRLPLCEIAPLTHEDYWVRGCTALIDAIGTQLDHIGKIHRYARKEDVPANTMFVIITDGQENASRKYSSAEVKRSIEKRKADGWEFLFIGANIDAVETAKHFGISEERAVNYHADRKGTRVLYDTVANAVGCVRKCAPLQADWCEEIDKDFKSR
jgi:uncharacterized protein YegL